jgi:3-methyladenine DNA glycosylase/8-oxoguanine DNA glycosylase
VLAIDDFGVRNNAGRMAGLGGLMQRDELLARGELWRPWRSVASLWLWADQG